MKKYQGSKSYYKYLQKTEKVQFKENDETKLLVTATYMNKQTISINDKTDEVFVVGIYHEDHEIKSLNSKEFNLTLREVKTKKELKDELYKERKIDKEKQLALQSSENNTSNSSLIKKKKKKAVYLEPISVQLLEKDSPLLEGISFVSVWSKFYLVHFQHIAGNRLSLQIRSKKSEKQIQNDIDKARIMALTKKKKKTKKKKIKVKLYNSTILNFAKVAKYAL